MVDNISADRVNCPACGQENEIQREFCWACHGKLVAAAAAAGDLGLQPDPPSAIGGLSLQPDPPPSAPSINPYIEESLRTEDLHTEWGEGVQLAYTPSGESGDTTALFLSGVIGFGVGLLKGAGLLALALVINVIHNLLPVFIFVLPLVIAGIMLAAPFVVGMTVGSYVGDGISSAGCRRPGQAGGIAVLCSMVGLILFLVVAQFVTDPGESFMFDWLLWFVRIMVGGSLSFTWLVEPEPLSSSWEVTIMALFGLSAVLGLFSAYHTAAEVVRSVSFCERCQKNLTPQNLWSVSPAQTERTARAFQSLNYDELQQIPHCSSFDNFVSVELWTCTCDSRGILELVAHGIKPATDDDDEDTPQGSRAAFLEAAQSRADGEAEGLSADP